MYKMDSKNMKLFVFNLKIIRLTGLYQILNSYSKNVYGINLYRTIVTIIIALLFMVSLISSIGLYYTMNDTTSLTYNLGCIGNLMFSSYKMINILYYSNDIWLLFETKNMNAMSNLQYNKNLYRNWKKHTHIAIIGYIIISVIPLYIWCLSPYIFNNTTVNIRNLDGKYSKYKLNCLNIFVIVAVDTYNTNFGIFYSIEVISLFAFYYFSIIFDSLAIYICFSLSYQLESIYDRIKSLGYNSYSSNGNIMSLFYCYLIYYCFIYK